jgi:biopolymer transport protein ExbB
MTFTETLHHLTFGLMIAAAVVAAVVSVERMLFAGMNLRRARAALQVVQKGPQAVESTLGKDADPHLVRGLLGRHGRDLPASVRQDQSDADYIHARDELFRRLWMLDTVVTAAPLLGLLGTIFGIVDTFLALSSSGMSDPAAVSAGIGTALYAMALGISIALIGLLCFNFLSDRNERICEHMKMLVLKL